MATARNFVNKYALWAKRNCLLVRIAVAYFRNTLPVCDQLTCSAATCSAPAMTIAAAHVSTPGAQWIHSGGGVLMWQICIIFYDQAWSKVQQKQKKETITKTIAYTNNYEWHKHPVAGVSIDCAAASLDDNKWRGRVRRVRLVVSGRAVNRRTNK